MTNEDISLWWRRALVTAIVPACAGGVWGLGWLIKGLVGHDSTPFHHVWTMINLPAIVIAMGLSGNVHAPPDWAAWSGLLSQWLPIGFLLSCALVRRR